jgi:hypothetical protein
MGSRHHPVHAPVLAPGAMGPGAVRPGGADADPDPMRTGRPPLGVGPDVGEARDAGGMGRVRLRERGANAEDDSAQGNQAGDGAEAPTADRQAAPARRPKASRGAGARLLLVGT